MYIGKPSKSRSLAYVSYDEIFFDNDLPVPEDYKVVSGEKIEDFPQDASIDDKIEFLKKNGK